MRNEPAIVTDFESASRAVLSFLHERLGFALWMVTRTEGDNWIVLQTEDHGYDVGEGTVFRWVDSFCSHMVEGRGPRMAPQSDLVPVYAAAAIGRQVKIGAYVGVPLTRSDGSLFGTLCAIDPVAQPEAILKDQKLIELLAALVSTLLVAETGAAKHSRRAERAEAEALADPLTGLFNRRGWDRLLVAEEERCRRYGHPACVVVADLDGLKRINDVEGHGAGDGLIVRSAELLREAARSQDLVARLGGDEFGVLGVECDARGARALMARIRTAFEGAGIGVSLGLTLRTPKVGLQGAWAEADRAMYAEKKEWASNQSRDEQPDREDPRHSGP